MKVKTYVALLCLAFMTSPSFAGKTPNALTSDERVKQVMYDPNQVYEIRGTYGYQTSLEFGSDETVKVVTLGDTIAWQTVPYNNRVFLKPVEPNAATNLTIITDKHTYYFMLSSGRLSKDTTFLVRFRYPNAASNRISQSSGSSQQSTKESKGFDPASLNLDYSTSGNKRAIPLSRVFDDGQFTFFKFDDNTEIPSIYTVGKDGTEAVVNTRREGSYIVVERTSDLFTLRNGADHLCVKNNEGSTHLTQENTVGRN